MNWWFESENGMVAAGIYLRKHFLTEVVRLFILSISLIFMQPAISIALQRSLYQRIHHAVLIYGGGTGQFTTGLEQEIKEKKAWNEDDIQHFVKLLYKTRRCQQVTAFLERYPSIADTHKGRRLVFVCHEIPLITQVRVVFQGNHAYSAKRILRVAGISQQQFPIHDIQPEKWSEAISTFYKTAGFFPPKIQFNTEALQGSTSKFRLTITIREGEPKRIRYRLYPMKLCKKLRIEREKKIHHKHRFDLDIQNTIRNLINQFRESGYPFAKVDYRYQKENATLTFSGHCGPRILLVIKGWPEKNVPRMNLSAYFKPDEGWSIDSLGEIQAFLRNRLEQLGYRDAEVQYRVGPPSTSALKRIFFVIQPGPLYLLRDVSFKGIPPVVLPQITQKIKLPLRWNGNVLRDIQVLINTVMNAYGYTKVRCNPSSTVEGTYFSVTFSCTAEKPVVIGQIEFFGNVAIEDNVLGQVVPIRVGDVYRDDKLYKAQRVLQEYYWRHGFFHVEIDHIVNRIDESKVNIQFRIIEGDQVFFGHVIYRGLERTSPWVMGKIVKIKKGEPFSLTKLERIQNSLYRLGIFSRVDIQVPAPRYMEPHQDLVFDVKEADPFQYSIGIGYQERDKIRGIFSFTHRNFLGQALLVSGLLRMSFVNRRALISIGSPFFFSKLIDWRISAETEFQDRVTFDLRRDRLLFQLFQSFRRRSSYLFQLEFSKTDVRNINLQSQNLLIIAREFENLRLTKLTNLYIRDYRNDPLFPTKGSFTSLQGEFSFKPLGSDVSFVKMKGTYVRYIQWYSRFILAISLRMGWGRRFGKSPILPISQRFFEGGSRSHRGFALDELGPKDPINNIPTGGNAFWIVNLEERIRLHEDWSSVFFLDVGNVFTENFRFEPAFIRKAAGIGIRYHAIFGIIGVDLSYLLDAGPNETRWHLFVTVGQPF